MTTTKSADTVRAVLRLRTLGPSGLNPPQTEAINRLQIVSSEGSDSMGLRESRSSSVPEDVQKPQRAWHTAVGAGRADEDGEHDDRFQLSNGR
jgi:hypothetical protein